MNFDSILQFLQGLLTNKQTTQASEFGQGLDFSKSQLAQQGTQFGQTLAQTTAAQQAAQQLAQQQLSQQGTQFGQTLTEQTAARLAAQNLAQEQQRQAEQQQQFGQTQQTYQSSMPFLQFMNSLQKQLQPGTAGKSPAASTVPYFRAAGTNGSVPMFSTLT
jgi:hypothetical protein